MTCLLTRCGCLFFASLAVALPSAGMFEPLDGGVPTCGSTGGDGSSTLSTFAHDDGTLVGPHRVPISKFVTAGVAAKELGLEAAPGLQPKAALPVRYADPKTSGLEATVEAGGRASSSRSCRRQKITCALVQNPRRFSSSRDLGDIDARHEEGPRGKGIWGLTLGDQQRAGCSPRVCTPKREIVVAWSGVTRPGSP